ncbi:cell division protein SepF [Williamsia sterculiae]|uniref:Cell division protein SepF n=1 Tax=Williamsia sterculiae TaxID=1344003 RepID=A0A1N7H6V0_9NOCA|nr:cell division protein SepF [Williamsia sterculiae]SIS20531.1 cell division inhibitor SepF [Williamsia sterculiae]
MTTMQKFKAYFGMVPPDEYEDDYLDDMAPRPRREDPRERYERTYRDDYYGDTSYREAYPDDFDRAYEEPAYEDAAYAGRQYQDEAVERSYARAPEFVHAGARRAPAEARFVAHAGAPEVARLEPLTARAAATRMAPRRAAVGGGRSALAVDHRADQDVNRLFDEESPLAKITTLRPSDYSEARTIGERFRDGSPVIMDLVDMSNDDAKRLVDFAAGLAFALRGSFDKVATKVFLLSPADIDVSPEDRRKIAETGFYNHS